MIYDYDNPLYDEEFSEEDLLMPPCYARPRRALAPKKVFTDNDDWQEGRDDW